jgi:hypothetical protein
MTYALPGIVHNKPLFSFKIVHREGVLRPNAEEAQMCLWIFVHFVPDEHKTRSLCIATPNSIS